MALTSLIVPQEIATRHQWLKEGAAGESHLPTMGMARKCQVHSKLGRRIKSRRPMAQENLCGNIVGTLVERLANRTAEKVTAISK